ncbi:Dynactin subunit 2 [Boothiomyces macroporosus]|uniref:Dynactin subunit 2 n=1 Tax=Boothiomyces macroporosus TaxID=261099 RepID=A0AAD5Y4F6_9FUNG|nr:Dynactin subunit 2 [Boothiomyces macroporosus]
MDKKSLLLDIDTTAPDVLEAEGTAITINGIEQVSDYESEEEVDIIRENVAVSQAAEKFIEKKPRKKSKETLKARYERLEWEVEQLAIDLAVAKKQETEFSNKELMNQVANLQAQLKNLNKSVIESPLEHIFTDPDNTKSLVKEIQEYKTHQVNETEDGKLVYQLVYDAKTAPDTTKDFQLEQRITNLERIIGLHAIDPVNVMISQEDRQNLFNTTGTLIGALERLDMHFSLITEPKVLDIANRKISEALLNLEKLVELSHKQRIDPNESHDLEKKISYIYNQMMKLESVANIIPNLVMRLKSLQSLHAETAQFAETLKMITTDQANLKTIAVDTQTGIEKLNATINENNVKIANNIAALDERMRSILNKKAN